MTYEEKATALADALLKAEDALAGMTLAMRNFVMDPAFSGPITKKTFIRQAQGVEGALGRLHLDISAFDPRPKALDGGGK